MDLDMRMDDEERIPWDGSFSFPQNPNAQKRMTSLIVSSYLRVTHIRLIRGTVYTEREYV